MPARERARPRPPARSAQTQVVPLQNRTRPGRSPHIHSGPEAPRPLRPRKVGRAGAASLPGFMLRAYEVLSYLHCGHENAILYTLHEISVSTPRRNLRSLRYCSLRHGGAYWTHPRQTQCGLDEWKPLPLWTFSSSKCRLRRISPLTGVSQTVPDGISIPLWISMSSHILILF